jgi:hypothetical protein
MFQQTNNVNRCSGKMCLRAPRLPSTESLHADLHQNKNKRALARPTCTRFIYHNCTKHEKTDSGKISFGGFADATLWVIPLPSPIPPRSWCYESQASESARAQIKLRDRTVAVASLHSCSKAQNEFFLVLSSVSSHPKNVESVNASFVSLAVFVFPLFLRYGRMRVLA